MALGLVATLSVGCQCLSSGSQGAVDAGPAPVAHLVSKRGQVSLERGGQLAPAELGYLYDGDALETGPGSEAKVRFSGERTVEVGPDARFMVTQDARGIVLDLARGVVVSSPGGAGLSIQTPFGKTRLAGDQSAVSIGVTGDAAQVEVLLGAVEFVGTDGRASRAQAGEKLTLSLGKVVLVGAADAGVRADEPVRLAPIVMTVQATGRAELKKKDAKKWKGVARGGEPLSSGDAVRVRDGRAQLLADDGAHLSLAAGGELLFERAAGQGDAAEARIDLKKGLAQVQVPAGKHYRLELGNLSVTSTGGQFGVEKTADGVQVVSDTGDVVIEQAGNKSQVLAGQQAKVGTKGSVVQDQAKGDLVLPSRNGMRVFHTGLHRATLAWEGGVGEYDVTVAQDSELKQLLLSGRVHKPSVNVVVPPRGMLFWRVRDVAGKEVDRGSAVFSPEPRQADLSRNRNEVMEGSDKTTIYFQDKPPSVTFNFKPEPSAVTYRLLVYQANALDKPIAEKESKEERVALPEGALGEGNYLWSVTPIDVAGKELRGGKMNKLEMSYDNAVPSLVVRSPANGTLVSGASIEVSGIAPVGGRVYVNGRSIPLDEKARFFGTATPVGNPPLLVFRLVQASGAESMTVRTLRKAR